MKPAARFMKPAADRRVGIARRGDPRTSDG
jgi:hypothetical protein